MCRRLQNNNITGDIPVSLASLPSLEELNLSNNNLSGTVPSALLNEGLILQDFGNPQLCNLTSGCPPSTGQNNTTHHNNTVLPVVGGVVGGLFVAAAIALVTIYVFCHKQSTRSGGGSGLWFVYLSFLSLQINFHSKVKFSFSFSFGKTCGYCHMITSAVENQNFEKSYNCDHCSLFHHIDKTLKGK
jgi:hypothetical protein